MTTEKDYEFRYEGENYIDINTLLSSQFHFVASLSEIQRELYPEAKLNIKIGAFKEGSFVVQLLLETSFLHQLFTKDNLDVAKELLETFAAYITAHQFFKGKKAIAVEEKPGDTVQVTNSENVTININKQVYNIYRHNHTLSQSVQKNFETLSNDESIEGIEIREDDTNQSLLHIEQVEFPALAKPNPYMDKEQDEEMHKDQTVYIKKPNLMPEKNKVWNWELIYKGRDIKAKITDKDFVNIINDGQAVAQGDRLEVDLKIYQRWHEKFNTFVESGRFEITKVHKIVNRNNQSRLFDKP